MKLCDQGPGLNSQMIEWPEFPSSDQIKLTLNSSSSTAAQVCLARTPASGDATGVPKSHVFLSHKAVAMSVYRGTGSAISGGFFGLWDGRLRNPVFLNSIFSINPIRGDQHFSFTMDIRA